MDNETGAGIVERGPMEQKLIDIGEKNTGLILRIGEEMQAFAREQDAEAANLHNAVTERDALIIELAAFLESWLPAPADHAPADDGYVQCSEHEGGHDADDCPQDLDDDAEIYPAI